MTYRLGRRKRVLRQRVTEFKLRPRLFNRQLACCIFFTFLPSWPNKPKCLLLVVQHTLEHAQNRTQPPWAWNRHCTSNLQAHHWLCRLNKTPCLPHLDICITSELFNDMTQPLPRCLINFPTFVYIITVEMSGRKKAVRVPCSCSNGKSGLWYRGKSSCLIAVDDTVGRKNRNMDFISWIEIIRVIIYNVWLRMMTLSLPTHILYIVPMARWHVS